MPTAHHAYLYWLAMHIGIEPNKRAKYLMPSGIIIMIRGGQNN